VNIKHLLILVLSASLTSCGVSAPESQPPANVATPSAAPADPMAGLGDHRHPIATKHPEAQRYFDRGFALVFAFNHEEAVRSFQRAAELDPSAAMPHWGIAWALGPNYNLDIDDPRAKQAYDAIERARSLAKEGPAVEREYIEAMAVRYSPDLKADRAALARAYSQAMGALSKRNPDDLDAATLYAESLMNLRPWKLWTLDGKPAPGTHEIIAILESVLRRNPSHIGANHYYIHSTEASRSPERALASAKRLETLVPAAGHLVHMPAHVYARTGDHDGAARANQAGAEADRVYLKTAPADSLYGMMYYSHNLHFLADSHMMQGRLADARTAANELAERLLPHAAMMPMIESMAVMPTSVLLRFNQHDEILKLPEPAADRPVMQAWWRFARGVAFAKKRQVAEATAERTAFDQVVATVPDTALFGGTGLESAAKILSLARLVLDARIAWAREARAESLGLWMKAVAAGDLVAYDEPPIWFYPLRESLGAVLLETGRAADAERVFREDLVRHPRNPRSLFGLHESLVKQGRATDAAWIKSSFDDAWKNADSQLQLAEF
jgi:tetratricopeptide (TPR) repeat protein/predicted small lipoprotein YifL